MKGCKQYLSVQHLQAIVWKDTLYEHRFYQTVFIHGEETCAHLDAHSCTCIRTHCGSDSRGLIHTYCFAHICTALVLTQTIPHLPQPLNLRPELCSKCSLESQQRPGWKSTTLNLRQRTRAMKAHNALHMRVDTHKCRAMRRSQKTSRYAHLLVFAVLFTDGLSSST